jgi:hypothetical protein
MMAKVAWTVKAQVWRALNNAVENGFDFSIGFVGNKPLPSDLEKIAVDIVSYDADLEGVIPGTLHYHISSWIDASPEARKAYVATFEDRQKKLDQENQVQSQEPADLPPLKRWVVCNATHEDGVAMPNLFSRSYPTYEDALNFVVEGELELIKDDRDTDNGEFDAVAEREGIMKQIADTLQQVGNDQHFMFELGDYTWLIGEVTI